MSGLSGLSALQHGTLEYFLMENFYERVKRSQNLIPYKMTYQQDHCGKATCFLHCLYVFLVLALTAVGLYLLFVHDNTVAGTAATPSGSHLIVGDRERRLHRGNYLGKRVEDSMIRKMRVMYELDRQTMSDKRSVYRYMENNFRCVIPRSEKERLSLSEYEAYLHKMAKADVKAVLQNGQTPDMAKRCIEWSFESNKRARDCKQ